MHYSCDIYIYNIMYVCPVIGGILEPITVAIDPTFSPDIPGSKRVLTKGDMIQSYWETSLSNNMVSLLLTGISCNLCNPNMFIITPEILYIHYMYNIFDRYQELWFGKCISFQAWRHFGNQS